MSDAEEFFEARALAVEQESAAAAVVFQYAVRCDNGNNFFCDSYTEQVEGDRTRLTLRGAWVRDDGLPSRFADTVEIVTRTYDIVTLPKAEL